MKNTSLSSVEKWAQSLSPFKALYAPTEKVPVIVVEHFPLLGQFTALRFLEWVQKHPEGVISLPTGKSPEYFIKWVKHLLRTWDRKETQKLAQEWGLRLSSKPKMRGLHFVQIDEFYPVLPTQTNSFNHYVKNYYIRGFGLDPKRALLMDVSKMGLKRHERVGDIWPDKRVDLSLRYRHGQSPLEETQKSVLERIDQWCVEYEQQIRELGGIGFFLGGIGPDGHIGFNIRGSDPHSTTRLCSINYETQAAAAGDLGGIEMARQCLVVTIGLNTITYNPSCTAIVMAAGEAKARIVALAVESSPDVRVPATALHQLPNARFYLTRGAAKLLTERRLVRLKKSALVSEETQERIIVGVACRKHKSVLSLTRRDLKADVFGQRLLTKVGESARSMVQTTYRSIIEKIEHGTQTLENKRFLHTEPHHDDVMLGYLPYVVRHFRRASNDHHFMTLTSGFTAVTNEFMKEQVANLTHFMATEECASLRKQRYFKGSNHMARNRDVWQYLDGIAAKDELMQAQGCARRFLRNLGVVYRQSEEVAQNKRLAELREYFETVYPGQTDSKPIQALKGMCREWEAECLWGYYGLNCDNVIHMRLGFYTGDIFSKQPSWAEDVRPIVAHLEAIAPDVVTVAFDPEGSGPDTHYKVLQILAEALRIYQERSGRLDVRVWGYRNVWYRFDPSEANIFVPVSLCMFSVMQEAFKNAYLSQRKASFPSYEYEGPFSGLAQRIQVEQYQTIKTCLGRDWFYRHRSPLIRATRGFVFLKEMNVEAFYESCRRLRQSIEEMD